MKLNDMLELGKESREFFAVLFIGLAVTTAFVLCMGVPITLILEHSAKPCIEEGVEAGYRGMPVESCPYGQGTTAYKNWKTGWQEGKKKRDAEGK